jgi:hypothetical protein
MEDISAKSCKLLVVDSRIIITLRLSHQVLHHVSSIIVVVLSVKVRMLDWGALHDVIVWHCLTILGQRYC